MSRRRNPLLARPKSMIVDQKTIESVTEEPPEAYSKARFNKRSSLNRNSNSTVSSITSIAPSNSSMSLSSDAVANSQLSSTVNMAVMSPSSSSSTIASLTDKSPGSHSLSSPPAKTQRRDIFGRMRSSLDRRRNLPWNQSNKGNSQLSNLEPVSDLGQLPRAGRKNNLSTAFSLKEMTRSTSALFIFNSSKVSISLPSTSPSATEGSVSSTYSSTPSESSPPTSISSASSPCSPSPVRSHHENIPATIVEDEATNTEPPTFTPKTLPTAVTSQVPRLRPVSRSRQNNGQISRPQTIVGFFRQSRLFFSSTSKSCDVFGLPLRDAVIATRLNVSRDDERYWVPAIVTRCVEFLNQYGIEEEGLYRISGSVSGIEELKQEFAFYGQEMVLQPGIHDVHTIASLLKAYIRALPDELITPTPRLFSILTQIAEEVPYDAIQDYMATLPVYNFSLLRMLCTHFSLVTSACAKNRMTLSNLMLILCPTMRIDSKLFSWMVEDVDRCMGPVGPNFEYAAVTDGNKFPTTGAKGQSVSYNSFRDMND
ncbi:Rho GTPase activation protein [Lipomyces orientalis]|uniref:Rho GTPase activation protein n=1 Tax=Lipomyces orientalis TaxID=1233043 RepID=A0ACC3TK81_9ASCO